MKRPKKHFDFGEDLLRDTIYVVICLLISGLLMLILVMTKPFVEECLQRVYTVEEDTIYANWKGNTETGS